ncbi:GMC family oxidoreductase N-terminal domain-containing protein [Burkholderia multivorans]|nr:GMC family oxidoreductase N-terminal domain-containing protein [Burkholderia multivorans]MBU9511820.1 GMC family oxidoreductase N-terminal domain-containing protein [Burkholderia multivorans]
MSKQQSGETAVQSSPTDRRRFLNRVLDTGAASLMAMALPAIAADGDAATQRSPRFDAAPANNASFDYVIVGAGSAGSVLARRLVDAGMRVLVLEAGPPDTLAAIHDPTKAAFLWHTPVDWSFTTRAQSHSLDTTVYWPRGKTLGGSSSINGMMYVRGLPVDYDNWVAAGATGWGWKDVQPYFRKSERCHATGLSAAHGTDGLLDVTQPEPTPLARAFVDASVQAGLRHVIDYNDGEDSSGVSFPQFTITPAGERASAWECYVRPIAASDRLTVLTGAQVLNVVIEKGVATGVRYLHDGKPLHVRAVREVLLSAGSIMSPAILMHSGIGPASQLRKLGIKVVADVPGVGANLHDHLVCPLLWSSRRPVAMGGTSGMNAHLFHKSHPSLAAPDTQSLLFTMPVPVPDYPKVEQGFTLYAGLDRPYSRGAPVAAQREPARQTGPRSEHLCGPARSRRDARKDRRIAGRNGAARAEGLAWRGGCTGTSRSGRRCAAALRGKEHRLVSPPGRNGAHGARRRSRGGARCVAAGARRRATARGRRVGDADRADRQYQCPDDHARRAGERHDPRAAFMIAMRYTCSRPRAAQRRMRAPAAGSRSVCRRRPPPSADRIASPSSCDVSPSAPQDRPAPHAIRPWP